MLKNWTVITKPVKNGSDGIIARERYLNSRTHQNHKNTEAILDIVGNESTSKRIILAGEKYRLRNKLKSNRRGRPLSSFAIEFCLTLPKQYRPTPNQWRAVIVECCQALADHLALSGDDKKTFYNHIRAVCHQQQQTGTRGTGDHVHLIVSKVLKDKVLTGLQKKAATKVLKQAFTTATATHLQLSIDEYKPYELDKGRRLEKWQYESLKLEAANAEQAKLQKKLEKQIRRWEEAVAKADMKQIQRQRTRIEKSLQQLKCIKQNPK
ncbi:TPA: hypothetical protein ACN33E_000789 [Vibrio parahaemolyticus]|uniref:hypothetical protein n=7 Tax=Vibrio parahaemolyticus TaxID=670 RepID=UPI00111F70DF|nr:hypothetical protein [Vibrio parahaemolyticus]EGQ9921643.1 hypothetical protein [Vibrio parahaemolyticus]MDF4359118.1 hypothetical protein [Vibrio parahaemolyticus]MDF4541490.1 hypothetical protein [Vibrio parahaemolyticus]MDG2576605.1 hypothetical protein [Vibrio parahaemolyticus]MDG2796718.1 hypothetical protein [Vibrio parahaemolyticus]